MTAATKCRICLCEHPYKDIFTSKVRVGESTSVTCHYIMRNFFKLNVTFGDGLPSSVCRQCFLKLSSAYKLKILAEKSYLSLLDSILKRDTLKNLHIDPHIVNNEVKKESDLIEDNENGIGECGVREIKIEALPLSNDTQKKMENERENKKYYVNDLFDEEAKVCDLCGKEVKHLKEHMKRHDVNRKRYPCTICHKSFLTKSSNWRHRKTEHCNDKYFCRICKKHYKFKYNHIRSYHSLLANSYECKVCAKKLPTVSQFNYHMSHHTEERPYLCQVCGKSFRTKQVCNDHRNRVHDKEKKFECANCSKRFNTKGEIKVHMVVHTKAKTFKCDECGRLFPRMQALKTHLARHSGVKRENCQLCDKSFVNKGALKSHMISHTKEKKYDCRRCGAKFGRIDHRNRHERNSHKNHNSQIQNNDENCC